MTLSTLSSTPKARGLRMPTKKRREFLDKAMLAYTDSVVEVAAYLESRGISSDTAARWRLGFVKDALPGHEEYLGRLSIPYLTPSGTIAMKFRCTVNHDCKAYSCVKYLAEPGEAAHLFGVWNLRYDQPSLILTEGELDAVVSTACGARAVGIPGASMWQPWWVHVFEGYDEVILVRDGDQAGRAMAEMLAGVLVNLRIVKMPESYDVSRFVCEYGEEAYLERLKV